MVDLKWFGVHLPEGVSVVDKDILSCRVDDLEGYEQVDLPRRALERPDGGVRPRDELRVERGGAVVSRVPREAGRGAPDDLRIVVLGLRVHGQRALRRGRARRSSSYPYGISKLQGEQGVLQMQDEGFSTIALRKGTICGYSPRMRFDLIVNTMYKSLHSGRQNHRQQPVAVATDPRHARCSVGVSACNSGRLLDQRDLQHRVRQLHRRTGRGHGQGEDGEPPRPADRARDSSTSRTTGTTRSRSARRGRSSASSPVATSPTSSRTSMPIGTFTGTSTPMSTTTSGCFAPSTNKATDHRDVPVGG